jgi:hypothetical protein
LRQRWKLPIDLRCTNRSPHLCGGRSLVDDSATPVDMEAEAPSSPACPRFGAAPTGFPVEVEVDSSEPRAEERGAPPRPPPVEIRQLQ